MAHLSFRSRHPAAARPATFVIANPAAEPVTLDPGPLLARAGGYLGEFADRTPDQAPLDLKPGQPVTLAPQAVRILAAQSRAAIKPKERPRVPDGEGRVIIENVWPEIDGGRSPVKRVVGDVVEVWADIFTDGHEKIAAAVIYRVAGDAEWRWAPMRFYDNDRWVGRFAVERNARYEFTIEAWRDPFSSWLDEIRKKLAAGQMVRLETIEGVHIAEEAASRATGADA